MRALDRFSDPIPELKRQVALEIAKAINGLDGHNVAAFMRTDQARVSDLRKGKLAPFSANGN